MRSVNRIALTLPAAIAILAFSVPASAQIQTGAFSVNGTASVFPSAANSNGSVDNSATAPFVVSLTPGTGRTLTFSTIAGTVTPASSNPNSTHGADGGTYDGNSVNITSLGPISGIIDTNDRTLALYGVFLSANPETGSTAPARLDFSGNHAFTSLTPLLDQTFFIGDGLTGTGTGAVQNFFVPNSASFLQLGFGDAFVTTNIAFQGAPSAYGDNAGAITGNFAVTGATATPEPGSLALLFTGVIAPAGALLARRRRKA
jgi:hypothetical protein